MKKIYDVELSFRKEPDVLVNRQADSAAEAIEAAIAYAHACGWETKPYRCRAKEVV